MEEAAWEESLVVVVERSPASQQRHREAQLVWEAAGLVEEWGAAEVAAAAADSGVVVEVEVQVRVGQALVVEEEGVGVEEALGELLRYHSGNHSCMDPALGM